MNQWLLTSDNRSKAALPVALQLQPNGKVSISTMSKHFNQVVCVDHFYLDDVRLMRSMDLISRFSTSQVVESANRADAVAAFEACWVSHF